MREERGRRLSQCTAHHSSAALQVPGSRVQDAGRCRRKSLSAKTLGRMKHTLFLCRTESRGFAAILECGALVGMLKMDSLIYSQQWILFLHDIHRVSRMKTLMIRSRLVVCVEHMNFPRDKMTK